MNEVARIGNMAYLLFHYFEILSNTTYLCTHTRSERHAMIKAQMYV